MLGIVAVFLQGAAIVVTDYSTIAQIADKRCAAFLDKKAQLAKSAQMYILEWVEDRLSHLT